MIIEEITKIYNCFLNMKEIVIHDVNNPLGIIKGYSELMIDDSPTERGVISKILEKADKISGFIKGLSELNIPVPNDDFFKGTMVEGRILYYKNLLAKNSEKVLGDSLWIEDYSKKIKSSITDTGRLEEIIIASKRISNVASMGSLGSISTEDINKNSTYVDVLRATKGVIKYYINKPEVRKDKIGIENHYSGKPSIYTNESLIIGIKNVLISNAVESAPHGTNIKMGDINTGKNLEITLKNLTSGSPARRSYGLGKGIGLCFIKNAIEQLGGEYKCSPDLHMPNYEKVIIFGDEKNNVPKDTKIYSTKITIPTNL